MGPRFGDLWVAADGLKAGEVVIVEGLQSARPGGEVVPKPVDAVAVPAAAAAAPAGK
jgi:membrane fusion protein (multidrug efflux system)